MRDQQDSIARVVRAIDTIKAGGMVIMTDDEDRENEGDLVAAASSITPQQINFMAKEGRGLICLAMSPELIDRLELPMMEDRSKAGCMRETAFTVSIEAREGVTTGISAHDRAQTILTAIQDSVTPRDIVVPGHIFPLRARPGGCLERSGHTEGSVDIARLAGHKSAAVICEIMNDDGSMARMPDLELMSRKFDLPIVTIADLIQFRLMQERHVDLCDQRLLQTKYGTFQAYLFKSTVDGTQHFALTKGQPFSEEPIHVRVHNQRPLVDVFGDENHGGRRRIDQGLQMLRDHPQAVFVYLCREDHQFFMSQELKELSNQRPSAETHSPLPRIEMNQRQIGIGAQILRQLGVKNMIVHSTSKRPLKGLPGFGLQITGTEIINPSSTRSEGAPHG